jgi:hypothetical protein
MYLDTVSLKPPICRDVYPGISRDRMFTDWVLVDTSMFPRHEIVLKQQDGDDILEWLDPIGWESERKDVWTGGHCV